MADASISTAEIALASAVIVGFISFIGSRLGSAETVSVAAQKNKFEGDMKIAQYRVDWLDRLRNEIIELDKIIVDSILNQNYSNQGKIMTFQSTIPYHMNPNDPDAQAIEDAIYELAQADNGDTLIEARTKFRNLARPILKREWDKAKSEIKRAGADQARRMTPQGYGR